MSEHVYVASSWRNDRLDEVHAALAGYGLNAYDFRAHEGFHWSDVFPDWGDDWPNSGEMTSAQVREGLRHDLAERGFNRDIGALDECDACVLVLPAGNSAHLELGYAAALGRQCAVLLPAATVRPDLMWKVAGLITPHIEDVCEYLAGRLAA